MLKKYAPYIALLFGALLLFYVMSHQRGGNVREQLEATTDEVKKEEGFSRHPENIIYTRHARCRMECRHISESEVQEILQTGTVNSKKIEVDDRGKTYPIDGKTKGDKMIRIVVTPKKNDLVLVTVIDLDTEWPCDCH